MLHKINILIAQ